MQEAVDDVRSAVPRVRADLPADLRDPIVTKLDLAGQPVLAFTIASTRMDDEALSWFVDNDVVAQAAGACAAWARSTAWAASRARSAWRSTRASCRRWAPPPPTSRASCARCRPKAPAAAPTSAAASSRCARWPRCRRRARSAQHARSRSPAAAASGCDDVAARQRHHRRAARRRAARRQAGGRLRGGAQPRRERGRRSARAVQKALAELQARSTPTSS